MSPAAAPAKKATARVRRPVNIEQIGVDDYAGGRGIIKVLGIGPPDAGKTRWSSAFPRPLYLGCEPTVGASIVSRKIPYEGGFGAPHIIRINQADSPSGAMLDAVDMLKKVSDTRPPGGLPKYQTAVLDTLDGYQRLLKDEWVEQEQAAGFTGRDAWSFIETKMNLTLTRLLNLDMNVIILVHLQDKEVEEQVGQTKEKRTLYGAQLQGSIKDTIYNEFNLVALFKRELVGDNEVRGLSFEPTHTFPFLKDHFHLQTPGDQRLGRKFWPITMDDGTKGGEGSNDSFVDQNYGSLWSAIVQDLDDLPDNAVVEEVPQASGPTQEGVTPPQAGGPVAGAGTAPAKAPAKAAAKAAPKTVQPAPGGTATPTPPAAAAEVPPTAAPPTTPSAPATATTPTTSTTATASPSPAPVEVASESVDPGGADGGSPAAEPAEPQAVATSVAGTESATADAPASVEESATAVPTQEEAVATVQEQLGGQVVAEGAAADVAGGASDSGGCPICGKDMSKESPDLVQLSRLKHRSLVLPDGRKFYDTGGCCYDDYQALNEQKASSTGLYAPA